MLVVGKSRQHNVRPKRCIPDVRHIVVGRRSVLEIGNDDGHDYVAMTFNTWYPTTGTSTSHLRVSGLAFRAIGAVSSAVRAVATGLAGL